VTGDDNEPFTVTVASPNPTRIVMKGALLDAIIGKDVFKDAGVNPARVTVRPLTKGVMYPLFGFANLRVR
jgi:hypothetical protein